MRRAAAAAFDTAPQHDAVAAAVSTAAADIFAAPLLPPLFEHSIAAVTPPTPLAATSFKLLSYYTSSASTLHSSSTAQQQQPPPAIAAAALLPPPPPAVYTSLFIYLFSLFAAHCAPHAAVCRIAPSAEHLQFAHHTFKHLLPATSPPSSFCSTAFALPHYAAALHIHCIICRHYCIAAITGTDICCSTASPSLQASATFTQHATPNTLMLTAPAPSLLSALHRSLRCHLLPPLPPPLLRIRCSAARRRRRKQHRLQQTPSAARTQQHYCHLHIAAVLRRQARRLQHLLSRLHCNTSAAAAVRY